MVGWNEPFKQERTSQYWEEEGPRMLINAAMAMEKTTEPLAGLLIEKGAPGFSIMRPFLAETKSRSGTPILLGILDRAPLLQILNLQGKQDIVDWINEQAPPFSRAMAIIIVTANGDCARIEDVPDICGRT